MAETEKNVGTSIKFDSLKNKLFNKKILLPVVIVVAAIIVVMAVLIVYSSFKSAKSSYFEIEGRNFLSLYSDVRVSYDDFQNSIKPYKENVFQTRSEITTKFDPGNLPKQYSAVPQFIWDLIDKLKLVVDVHADYPQMNDTAKLSLLLEGQGIIDANVSLDKKTLGVQIPAIYDRYITADVNDFGTALSKLGFTGMPKKLLRVKPVLDSIHDPDEEFRAVIRDFGKTLYEAVPEDGITMTQQKNDTQNIRLYTVKLTETQFKTFVNSMLEDAAKDKLIPGLTFDNYKRIMMILDDGGYLSFIPDEYRKNLLYSGDVTGAVKSLENIINDTKFPEGFKMELKVDSSDAVIERTITLPFIDSTAVSRNIALKFDRQHLGNFKFGNQSMQLRIEQALAATDKATGSKASEPAYIDIKLNASPDNKTGLQGNSSSLDITVDTKHNFWQDFTMNFSLYGSKVNPTEIDFEDKYLFNLELLTGSPLQKNMIKGDIHTTSKKNDKKKTIKFDTALNAALDSDLLAVKGASAQIKLVREDKFGVDMTMPGITADNSLNLNTASDNDIQKAFKDVQNSFVGFLVKNQAIFEGTN